MKKSLHCLNLLFSICLLSTAAKAQTWEWAQGAVGTGNAYANDISIDDAGNSYITGKFYDAISFGSTSLTNPGESIYLAKYDLNGSLLWVKLAASAAQINVTGMCLDKSGHIAITGQFFSSAEFGDVNPVALNPVGDFDVFVAEYDDMGEIRWAKSSGGLGYDAGRGISTDGMDNLYVTGDFHISSFSGSASKIFIAKYDSNGNSLWIKMPQTYSNFHNGNGIKTDSSGNSYITGQFFDSLSFDSSLVLEAGNIEANIFIAKFNANGTTEWLQKAGAASGYAGGEAIAIDEAGNAFTTGFYRGTISFGTWSISGTAGLNYETFIAKCNSNGDFVWVNNATGAGTGAGISVDGAGNCYIVGHFISNITFGSTVLTNAGGTDIFLAKTNSSGDFVWASHCGGLLDANAGGICANSEGVYLTGDFKGAINFDSFFTLFADSSDYHVFLAKLNTITGIGEEGNSALPIVLFPNPATDEIQLRGLHHEMQYILYDVSGKVMSSGSANKSTIISLVKLESGIYFLQLTNPDSQKSTGFKFIKE